MSTPVSVEPPPLAHIRTDSEQERDLQAKIQRMISLQYEEQHQSSNELDDENGGDNDDGKLDDYGTEDEDPRSTIGMPKRTTTEMMSLSTLGNNNAGQFDFKTAQEAMKAPWPSGMNVLDGRLPPPSPQQGVGRGTLLFSSDYDPNHRRMNSDYSFPMNSSQPTNNQSQQPPPPPQQQQQQQQQQQSSFPPHQIYAGYGALGTTMGPQGDLPLQEDPHAQLQEHEFRYGNPDYHSPYEDDDTYRKQQRYRPEDSICAKFCCLYAPIANLLLQENVHRSFCYGSIDGMLTGSGIVSAFCAIEILSTHAPWEARLAVVAFTTAACVADAVCMAIGHVWTSFIVSTGHAQERSRERKQLDANKGDAKARLVDMLLARGMLKIDAMSLADTLEGYPDMFVSALLGDSLLAGADFAEDDTEDGQQHQRPLLPLGGGGGRGSDGSFERGFDSWKFPSYGQFNEIDHEPEAGNVNTVLKESQVEGFFMMFGFAIFAVIPSLLWLILPLLVVPNADKITIESEMTAGSGNTLSSSPTGGQVISLPSLVVSISGFIMWFLGVWKSRFLDSNWIMSGIENVVVLLACVVSSYGVGFALCYAMGGDEGLTLSNIVESRI